MIELSSILKSAGVKVIEQDGWKKRGRPGVFGPVKGVLCHHTAGGLVGNTPSLHIVQNGRKDLPGPLAQLLLARDGTYYVIAAGRCNHAGKGNWQGVTSGNTSFIGIEAENTGLPNDPWPEIQLEAFAKGVAAILKSIKRDSSWCIGHKEYALPKGRKPDPSFDMVSFRQRVAGILGE